MTTSQTIKPLKAAGWLAGWLVVSALSVYSRVLQIIILLLLLSLVLLQDHFSDHQGVEGSRL